VKKALIFGITGQDGSYLSELLLEKGYSVSGVIRRSSSLNTGRIDHIFPYLNLCYGDLTDTGSINKLIREIVPDEIYNLGAMSQVRTSFDIPEYTANTDALGALRVLEATRLWAPSARFYQASSSEMFGSAPAPQSESTPFQPRSPYAVSKVFSYYSVINYREAYGLHASNGILMNHESSRRGETFVTKKIITALVKILNGKQDKLFLGNLDARRDWGYAPDFVRAQWLMLQQEIPGDYVIATNETHSVREFLDVAGDYLGLDWHKYVEIDPKYFRPAEVDVLRGDYSKARRVLGWEPTVRFHDLVCLMAQAELDALNKA